MHNCLWMALGAAGLTKWPTAGHDRNVFRLLCLQRYKDIGARLQRITWVPNTKGELVVDFMKNGVFSMGPEDAVQKTFVRHNMTNEQASLEGTFVIHQDDYLIVNNHLELGAQLCRGKLVVHMHTLFPAAVVAGWATKRANEMLGHLAVRFAKEAAETQAAAAKEEASENNESKTNGSTMEECRLEPPAGTMGVPGLISIPAC